MPATRFCGLFFLLSFASYAAGMALLSAITKPGILPESLMSLKNELLWGGLLITVVHTLCNIGLISIFYRKVKQAEPYLPYAYAIAGVFSTFLLALGGLFLLAVLPLSAQAIQHENGTDTFALLLPVFSGIHFFCYQTGMALWGVSGLLLCRLLYRRALAPRFFPAWGIAGYLLLMTGTVTAFFGKDYSTALSIPGGLFEITLSVWLIVKGFNPKKTR